MGCGSGLTGRWEALHCWAKPALFFSHLQHQVWAMGHEQAGIAMVAGWQQSRSARWHRDKVGVRLAGGRVHKVEVSGLDRGVWRNGNGECKIL